jgi:hypothetical protein
MRCAAFPVRGVDRRVEEEAPDGRKLTREVLTKSLDIWNGTGLREPVAETGDETATRDGDTTMRRDSASAIAIAQGQRVLQHALDVGDEPSAWIIGPQQSTAAQQMRGMPTSAYRLCRWEHSRHTSAMRLLHAGVDIAVIALWLGHEQVETTQIYLHADLALKEKALARTTPVNTTPRRYRPPDALLAFLEAL